MKEVRIKALIAQFEKMMYTTLAERTDKSIKLRISFEDDIEDAQGKELYLNINLETTWSTEDGEQAIASGYDSQLH